MAPASSEKLQKSLGGIKDMGGLPTPCSSSTSATTRSPSPKPTSWASRSSPWSIPTTRRKASISSSRVTTTPPAPSACTPVASPMPCWKAEPVIQEIVAAGSTSSSKSTKAPKSRPFPDRRPVQPGRLNSIQIYLGAKMAEITASMVKELRKNRRADDGMQEGPDRSRWRHGQGRRNPARQAGQQGLKAAARVTAEGIVGVYISADAKLGAMVEVNCETDFVAKNDDFLALVQNVAELVATKNPADVGALSALPRSTVRPLKKVPFRRWSARSAKHVDPPLRPHRSPGRRCQLHPRRLQDRRADRPGRRRRSPGQGSGHAHRRVRSRRRSTRPAFHRAARRRAPHRHRRPAKPANRKRCSKIAEGTVQKFLKDVTLLDQVFVKAEDGKRPLPSC